MSDTPKPPKFVAQLPPMTPLQNVSRSPQEIAAHRGQTAALVDVHLESYWQADVSQMKRMAILADWCDELEKWPVDSIKAALCQWRHSNPNKKPNPGHILQILESAWAEHNAEQIKAVGQRWRPPQSSPAADPAKPRTICPETAIKLAQFVRRIPEVKA